MIMKCRHCASDLSLSFLDLGVMPASNAYLTASELERPEACYPLRVKVCPVCWLVQTEDYASAGELFTAEYAYFSSTSRSWLDHASRYCAMIIPRLSLGRDSHVIEIASNDGYLLKNFRDAGIPCLGIEPTASTAAVARAAGIEVLEQFFGAEMANSLKPADLIIGNNVYAHVPDINDFTLGLARALKPEGVITLEFPHLMRLVEFKQFDTVYHEHFSYLSLLTVARIFAAANLRIFDVEELPTHGGSLRIYGCHSGSTHVETLRVATLLAEERCRGMDGPDFYLTLQLQADHIREEFRNFLVSAKRNGRTVAAYGAAAKGNTLLNYAGIKADLLPYVCDAALAKQGKFLPGTHIPVLDPVKLLRERPDFIVILPWNIADEIRAQLAPIAEMGTRFVTAVPELRIE